MTIQIKPCDTVGNAYMVINKTKFGKIKKLAIGLTKHEAQSLKTQIKWYGIDSLTPIRT